MVFEAFPTQSKKMFKIYNKELDPMIDYSKVRFL